LGGAAVDVHVGGGHADNRAVVGDDHDVVVLGHHLHPGGLAGLFGDLIALQAEAAPVLGLAAGPDVLLDGGAIAVPVLGDGEQGGAGPGLDGPDDPVPFPELDAPDAHDSTAHGAHVALPEADGHAVVGGDEDVGLAVGLQHGHELVALVQGQAPQA